MPRFYRTAAEHEMNGDPLLLFIKIARTSSCGAKGSVSFDFRLAIDAFQCRDCGKDGRTASGISS
jgi:hypothetical protein